MTITQKRFLSILLGIGCLFFFTWFELFMQKRHYLIGGGINRVFLFLLINGHVVLVVLLLYLIIRHSIKLFLERRKEVLGSVFKRNLLFAFILFSVIPSFFVFFTAGKFITQSIDRWFQVRLGSGFASALKLHEYHSKQIRQDLVRDGRCLAQQITAGVLDEPKVGASGAHGEEMRSSVSNHTTYLLDDTGNEIVGSLHDEVKRWRRFRTVNDRTTTNLKKRFVQKINNVVDEQCFDFYGSLYWVKRVEHGLFIVVYRYPEAIRNALISLENSLVDYNQLHSMRNSIYLSYFFTFALLTLLILFLSIWCAFYLAKGISKPIQELLDATEKVRLGHWDSQVVVNPSSDLQNLAQGFNEMTNAVRQAHMHLELKNKEMLAILENISSAVFFVNMTGRIIFYNAAAQKLVSHYLSIDSFKDKKINVLGPIVKNKFFELVREFASSKKDQMVKEISFTVASEPRTFVVYGRPLLIPHASPYDRNGLLVVVEDLTDIVKINKIKTWQEAAKQMAHEIKNPLTPIQLATQRLQRKFKDVLSHEKSFFDCTTTILNQVKIIKDLVTHFSQFASMPAPYIEFVNINELVHEVLCLYVISYPDIVFSHHQLEQAVLIKTDKKKIKLALINLLDNAVRALKAHDAKDKSIDISTKLDQKNQVMRIIFSDNGPGISKSVKETLFLPYVSTEKKNMGLGLAIVHDSITQLGGSISLVSTNNGARFYIELPL